MEVRGINWIKHDGITEGMESCHQDQVYDKGTLGNLYTYENTVRGFTRS